MPQNPSLSDGGYPIDAERGFRGFLLIERQVRKSRREMTSKGHCVGCVRGLRRCTAFAFIFDVFAANLERSDLARRTRLRRLRAAPSS